MAAQQARRLPVPLRIRDASTAPRIRPDRAGRGVITAPAQRDPMSCVPRTPPGRRLSSVLVMARMQLPAGGRGTRCSGSAPAEAGVGSRRRSSPSAWVRCTPSLRAPRRGPRSSAARPRVARCGAGPVVVNVDREFVGRDQCHHAPRRVGVQQYVGDRLAGDPVRSQLDSRGQRRQVGRHGKDDLGTAWWLRVEAGDVPAQHPRVGRVHHDLAHSRPVPWPSSRSARRRHSPARALPSSTYADLLLPEGPSRCCRSGSGRPTGPSPDRSREPEAARPPRLTHELPTTHRSPQ